MQVLIDCDKVFERLTRGPFPNGSQADAEIQRHLAACHECRSLAESLRPAVTLLHESMTADQCTDLPVYRSTEEQLARIQDRIANQPLATLENTNCSPQSNRWRDLCWVLVPALLLAVTVLAMQSDRSPFKGQARQSRQVALGTFSSIDLLTSFKLPTACMSDLDTAQRTNAAEISKAFRCCSECHAAMNPAAPRVRCMGQLTTACLACHSSVKAANCCENCHEAGAQPAAPPTLASASCVACHQATL